MNEAAPPGTPDEISIARLKAWQPLDPVVMVNKQLIIMHALAWALVVWTLSLTFTIVGFVFSGDPIFFVVGVAVTIPYLVTCHRYSKAQDRVAELRRWCTLEGC